VEQERIFGPMFALMLLTVVVWAYMYAKRIPFIRSLNIEPDQLTPAELARRSPPSVSNPSDNLKNLFEMPIIFYALVLYLFVSQRVDAIYLTAGWAFFVLRALHSAVHCTINIVLLRFALYVVSCACLFFILARALISYL
jgi:hypothetical protein